MIIGVPRETLLHEHRVALAPSAVTRLVRHGHSVVVENDAGLGAHFSNHDFEKAGAQIVYSSEEAYMRADLVCRVSMLAGETLDLLRPGSTICAFHHLAVMPRRNVERLMELGITVIGYEIVRDAEGQRPVLLPFSEMAGRMAIPTARTRTAARRIQTATGWAPANLERS